MIEWNSLYNTAAHFFRDEIKIGHVYSSSNAKQLRDNCSKKSLRESKIVIHDSRHQLNEQK